MRRPNSSPREESGLLPDDYLIVFVKAPRPGEVKTRLAPALGPEGACHAYCRLVETLCSNLGTLSRVELRFSPDDAAEEIRGWLRAGWNAQPQGTGDLGLRLVRAFQETFARGARRVAIIGSDCPAVNPADIERAFAALRKNDVVIGPAGDGGYWLIGLREERPGLFKGIPWSTSDVLEQTIDRAARANLKLKQLRELNDIDTEADWNRFLKSDRRSC